MSNTENDDPLPPSHGRKTRLLVGLPVYLSIAAYLVVVVYVSRNYGLVEYIVACTLGGAIILLPGFHTSLLLADRFLVGPPEPPEGEV